MSTRKSSHNRKHETPESLSVVWQDGVPVLMPQAESLHPTDRTQPRWYQQGPAILGAIVRSDLPAMPTAGADPVPELPCEALADVPADDVPTEEYEHIPEVLPVDPADDPTVTVETCRRAAERARRDRPPIATAAVGGTQETPTHAYVGDGKWVRVVRVLPKPTTFPCSGPGTATGYPYQDANDAARQATMLRQLSLIFALAAIALLVWALVAWKVSVFGCIVYFVCVGVARTAHAASRDARRSARAMAQQEADDAR